MGQLHIGRRRTGGHRLSAKPAELAPTSSRRARAFADSRDLPRLQWVSRGIDREAAARDEHRRHGARHRGQACRRRADSHQQRCQRPRRRVLPGRERAPVHRPRWPMVELRSHKLHETDLQPVPLKFCHRRVRSGAFRQRHSLRRRRRRFARPHGGYGIGRWSGGRRHRH